MSLYVSPGGAVGFLANSRDLIYTMSGSCLPRGRWIIVIQVGGNLDSALRRFLPHLRRVLFCAVDLVSASTVHSSP